jgi:hypothetical protein
VANTAAEPEADISGNGEDDPSLSRLTTSSRMLLFIKLSAPATAGIDPLGCTVAGNGDE